MALITTTLLLRLHALSLLTLAYHLLFHPATILSSSALTLLGQSMHLPPATYQPALSPLTHSHLPLPSGVTDLCGLLALVLVAMAISEFVQAGGLSVPETLKFEKYKGQEAWRGQVPSLGGPVVAKERVGEELAVLMGGQDGLLGIALVRVLVQGGLCVWAYLWCSDRGIGGKSRAGDGVRAALGNQVVFTVALLDMLYWGWVWSVVREERRGVLRGVQEWKEARKDD